MKIILIEPMCKNKEHNEFISNFIKVHIDDDFKIFSESSLAKNILAESYEKLYLGDVSFISMLYYFFKEKGNLNIIFLSINKKFILFSIVFSFFKKIKSITIIPHAILNEIYRDKIDQTYRSKIKKIFFFTRFIFFLKLFLRTKKSKVLVLGKSIAINLNNLIKIKKDKIFWIHHPYDFTNYNKCIEITDSPKKIGFLGVPSKDKGFPVFSDFLEKHSSSVNNNYKFVHIGPSTSVVSNLSSQFQQEGLITRVEFEQAVQQLHYIIMPLPYEEYVLRASGTFFDAVKFEKPIIYSKNPFIQSYVDEIGQVGVEFDFKKQSINELFEILNSLDYMTLESNMRKLKKKLSLLQTSSEFQDNPND